MSPTLLFWLIRGAIVAAALSAIGGGVAWFAHTQRNVGREEVRAEWAAERQAYTAAALAEAEGNARETKRRLERQQENQRAQDAELARARDDAARNAVAADRLREQNAGTARAWRDALGNSATERERTAAADAIGLLADVLGRADRRAGLLAAYADAARVAGLKCERDYDALSVKP